LALTLAVALTAPDTALASIYRGSDTLLDAQAGGGLGSSVSISADGTVAVVGEPAAGGGAGAALVYTNAGGTWTLAQRLSAPSETGAGHFGASVAIDHDGVSVVVGAPDDDAGVGHAWVFALNSGVWAEQGDLAPSGAESGAGRLGASVAVAAGGQTVSVGAPMSGGGTGVVLVYDYDPQTGWYGFQHILGSGEVGSGQFGASLAVSNNGNALLVGAPQDSSGDGAAFLFSIFGLDSPYYQQRDEMTSPVSGANFGQSVALERLAGYGIIGAPLAAGGNGRAYGYWPRGGAWVQCAALQDDAQAGGENFGESVSLSSDTGSEVVVGAPADAGGAGAAYDFDGSECDWQADGTAPVPSVAPSTGDALGTSVTVAAGASDALAGAPGADSALGAVAAFRSGLITVPGAPVGVGAVADTTSADVTWSPPADDGGAPISGYTVTASPGGATCSTVTDGCTVTGLTPGQSYTFAVTASNSAGPGPAAGTGTVSIPGGAPQPVASASPTPAPGPAPGVGLPAPQRQTPSSPSSPSSSSTSSSAAATPARPVLVLVPTLGPQGIVSLTCRAASCTGTLSLVGIVTVTRHVGREEVHQRSQVLLGTGSYSLAAATSGTVTLRLTAIGRATLAARHPAASSVRLLATVRGGLPATAAVAVSRSAR
jgi:hypothetical protein